MNHASFLSKIKADLWIFDNDGTLYNPEKIEPVVNDLMIEFIANHYRISKEQAKIKRKELQENYQTKYTLIALEKDGIDQNRFIRETYLSINPEEFGICPNQKLQRLLSCIHGEKIVLTNNPSEFARLILQSLGIEKYFSKVLGMRELNFILKPQREAFNFLDDYLENNKKVVFVDDELKNIITAKEIGCTTVLASKQFLQNNSVDYHITLLF